jgi:hypothetical protein
MNLIQPGQVWENGKSVVKVQEGEDECFFKAIIFDIDKGRLRYSQYISLTEDALRTHLERLNCRLTDKILTTQ